MRIHAGSGLVAVLAAVAALSAAWAQSTVDAFVAKIPGANMASPVTLAAGTAAGTPGRTVEIPFSLASTGTAAPATFQIDVTFDPAQLTFVSARAGAALTAAGTGLSASVISSGDVRPATTGASQKAIAGGPVAYAAFTVTSQFRAGTPVTLANCMSASTLGSPLSTGCLAGSITMFTCDVNGDGSVNVADVQSLIDQALGALPPVNDLNHDFVVNVADIQKAIDAALGLGCPY